MNNYAKAFAPDLISFIEAQPRGTSYSELASQLRLHFGADRAVDERTLRQWWINTHTVAERKNVLLRDNEIREAVLDVLGRLNGREIMERLRSRFADSRLPSRSVLYRFLAAETAKAKRISAVNSDREDIA